MIRAPSTGAQSYKGKTWGMADPTVYTPEMCIGCAAPVAPSFPAPSPSNLGPTRTVAPARRGLVGLPFVVGAAAAVALFYAWRKG